jgi:hypothetical protein
VRRGLVALVAAVAVLGAVPGAPTAQDTKLEVRDTDTLKSVLERQVGKRVTLAFTTGPELTGVVSKVGGGIVHLSEIQGREFFDAVVALDRVSAVLVRVRGR